MEEEAGGIMEDCEEWIGTGMLCHDGSSELIMLWAHPVQTINIESIV